MKLVRLLACVIMLVVSSAVLAEDPVYFADAKLKTFVENELGLFDPTPVDMLSLTSLDAENKGITSLDGLEYALNLRRLSVSYNEKIDDVSPLKDLTKLRWLAIDNNKIDSLSPLGNLTNLSYLNCHENDITDLRSISELTDLDTLIARYNPLEDLGGLNELTNLYELDLIGTGTKDISRLESLTHLDTLWLRDNEISDISPLAQLDSLDYLYLEQNQIRDMGPLMSIVSHLTVLDISDNPLDSVAYTDYIPQITSQYPDVTFRFDSRIIPPISPLDLLYVDNAEARDSDTKEDGTRNYPFDSIQEAIDVAQAGATVFVRPGRYVENLDFIGKAITVTGFDPNGPDTPLPYPVIDGGQGRQVVTFGSGEGLDTRLSGFIITGGYGEDTGGVFCDHSSPTIEHCLIVGNRAQSMSGKGGAVYCQGSYAAFINCSMHGNRGGRDGAGFYSSDSEPVVLNSILYGNTPFEILTVGDGSPVLSYSNIAGGYAGEQNQDADPLFNQPGYWEYDLHADQIVLLENDELHWIQGDYHLQSEAGRWDADHLEWVFDSASSPCMDGGDPNMPVGDESEANSSVINMGAYGGTHHASKSL